MAPSILSFKNINLRSRLGRTKATSKSTPNIRNIGGPLGGGKVEGPLPGFEEFQKLKDDVLQRFNPTATSSAINTTPLENKRHSARLSASDPGIRASYLSDKGTDFRTSRIIDGKATLEDGTEFDLMSPKETPQPVPASPELTPQKSSTFGPDVSQEAFKASGLVKANTIPIVKSRLERSKQFLSTNKLRDLLIGTSSVSKPKNGKQVALSEELEAEIEKHKETLMKEKAAKLEAFLRGESDDVKTTSARSEQNRQSLMSNTTTESSTWGDNQAFPSPRDSSLPFTQLSVPGQAFKRENEDRPLSNSGLSISSNASSQTQKTKRTSTLAPLITSSQERQSLEEARNTSSAGTNPGLSAGQDETPDSATWYTKNAALLNLHVAPRGRKGNTSEAFNTAEKSPTVQVIANSGSSTPITPKFKDSEDLKAWEKSQGVGAATASPVEDSSFASFLGTIPEGFKAGYRNKGHHVPTHPRDNVF